MPQAINSVDIDVDNNETTLEERQAFSYRWCVVDTELNLENAQYGDEQQLMGWLLDKEAPIVLVVPGEKAVAQQVAYDEKSKRHFAKMLPYEMEDQIIDDVEELHFSLGQTSSSQANIAYIDRQWFEELRRPFIESGFSISYCFADFQTLKTNENETIFWFNGDRLLVHSSKSMGFSSEKILAPEILHSFLSGLPEGDETQLQLSVYISDNLLDEKIADEKNVDEKGKSRQTLKDIERVFTTLAPTLELNVHSGMPPLSLENPQAINFCTGRYANKPSIPQQLKEFRLLGFLAIVAVLFFVVINFIDIYSSQIKNQQLQEQIVSAARVIIPQGNIQANPLRQLRSKLGQAESGDAEPSQSVYLLSVIAPIIQALDVDLSALNYNNKEKSLRLNVQAESFNLVEKLRAEIDAKGLFVELLSSNAIDNKFQARFRVSLEKR
jgi:general secretion pathway protein L